MRRKSIPSDKTVAPFYLIFIGDETTVIFFNKTSHRGMLFYIIVPRDGKETLHPAVGNHGSIVLVKRLLNNYEEYTGLPTKDLTIMITYSCG